MADIDVINKFDLDLAAPYSISKAGMNLAVAKFSAQYAKDGVLFISICPGAVNTGHYDYGEFHGTAYRDVKPNRRTATEEELKKNMVMFEKFKLYAPHFTGLSTPEAAVKDVISVFEKASLARGDGGSYVSHLGTKQWL